MTSKKCGACRKPKKNCRCGRRLFNGKDKKLVLSKLEEAYSMGADDDSAAFHANISLAALYRFMSKNPQFRDRRNGWRYRYEILARTLLIKACARDGRLALKFLERKDPQEFNLRYMSQREARDAKDLGNS